MTPDPSANRRRYLPLWFPWLPSDRLRRGTRAANASPDPAPVVLVEKIGGALRLAAVDPAAAQSGITPGLTLADARARTPSLRTVVQLARTDFVANRQPPRHVPHRHPRDVRMLPGSRSFH